MISIGAETALRSTHDDQEVEALLPTAHNLSCI
jgi:hypothetical protein